MSERERLLDLRSVTMNFGGLQVVSDLDLHVDEGEIVSVIGPNGAGKTTLFNLITGIYEPTGGDIVFAGESIKGLEPHVITGRGIARTFQTLRLFLNMSVRENVMAALGNAVGPEACLAMSLNGTSWSDWVCASLHYFACEQY